VNGVTAYFIILPVTVTTLVAPDITSPLITRHKTLLLALLVAVHAGLFAQTCYVSSLNGKKIGA
jgi:hypothetical protein